jgi:glutathione synthase/RimK-type ligase-like ATP-grasp enzyme
MEFDDSLRDRDEIREEDEEDLERVDEKVITNRRKIVQERNEMMNKWEWWFEETIDQNRMIEWWIREDEWIDQRRVKVLEHRERVGVQIFN